MKQDTLQVGALIAAIAIAGVARAAAPLPAATMQAGLGTPTEGIHTGGVPLSAFGDSYDATDANGKVVTHRSTPGSEQIGDAGGSAVVTASALPYLSVSTTQHGLEQGILTYNFEIIDLKSPANESNIDVGISATIRTEARTAGILEANYFQGANFNAGFGLDGGFGRQSTINYFYDTSNNCAQCLNMNSTDVTGTLGPTSTFAGNITLDRVPVSLRLNTLHSVILFALARSASLGGTNSAFASVDPTFTVPDGYELLLSPGLGNGALPEPTSWAMLIVGFGGVGGIMRGARRQRPSGSVRASLAFRTDRPF